MASRQRWWALATLCLSLLIIGIDGSVLNVALPTLARDLGATTAQLQWFVDSYILALAGLLLVAGALGDRYGRRRALQVGLVVFFAGSVLAAGASTPTELVITRALMGLGAAFIMPATLSLVTSVFEDPGERARAIGIWAGVSGVGIAVGPVTGGLLLEHFWWGSIFLVNVPIVVAALAGGRLFVPESRDPSNAGIDGLGAVFSTLGLAGLVWAIIEAPGRGWTEPWVLAGFAAAVVFLTAFAVWEGRAPSPMLDVSFFRDPRFSAASLAITLVFFALAGSVFLLTQHLQFVLGLSPLEAGLRIAPIAVVLLVAAPLSVLAVERVGTKVVVAGGLAIVATAFWMLTGIEADTGYPRLLLAFVMLGTGMGLAMAPATDSIMGSLPAARTGVGSAVNQTARRVGGVLGIAVIGSLFASGYRSRMGAVLDGTPMPPDIADLVASSVGVASEVATRIGGLRGELLADAARHAFVDGLGGAMTLAALAALGGVAVTLAFLPARPRPAALDPDQPSVSSAPSGQLSTARRAASSNSDGTSSTTITHRPSSSDSKTSGAST